MKLLNEVDRENNEIPQKTETEKIRKIEQEKLSSRKIERKSPFETLYEILRTDPQEGWYKATKNYMYLRRVIATEKESQEPQTDGEQTLSGFTEKLSGDIKTSHCMFQLKQKDNYQGSTITRYTGHYSSDLR